MAKELVNVIQETMDYDKFTVLVANRDTIRSHIENIKKSIEKNGNFTEFSPVIINEKHQIIDGQHRFMALKELGLPVFFIVKPGVSVKHAREMNKLNKGWGMMDWAKTYAVGGYRSYQNFLLLHEEYPNVAPSVLLQYAVGGEDKGMYAEFRDGYLMLPDQAMPKARARLELLKTAQEVAPDMVVGEMQKAFLAATNVDGYSHKRMLRKLAEYPQLLKFQRFEDNLRHLEDIYNYRYTARSRARFF